MALSSPGRGVVRKEGGKWPGKSQSAVEEGQRLRAEARRLIEEVRQKREHVAWLVEDCKRRWKKDFHQSLQAAIQASHRCKSEHLASFAVRKALAERMVWEGTVEEFRLLDHPEAERCYAWHYVEDGKRQSFSLLKLPPVESPQLAVQLALAARELGARSTETWMDAGLPSR